MEGETHMNTSPDDKIAKDKRIRKLLVTMAVSAPIIFWIAALLD
jgi:hypothetical protein